MEKINFNAEEQAAANSSLKGKIYQSKVLNPRRIKGLGAFGASLAIYSYLPFLYAYMGTTVPMLGACFAGLYGMYAFA